jgi:hypothetical protein
MRTGAVGKGQRSFGKPEKSRFPNQLPYSPMVAKPSFFRVLEQRRAHLTNKYWYDKVMVRFDSLIHNPEIVSGFPAAHRTFIS